MKSIKGLSSIALISLLNAYPCLAWSQSFYHIKPQNTPVNTILISDQAQDQRRQEAEARREQYRQEQAQREQDARTRRDQNRDDQHKRDREMRARYEQDRLDRIERDKKADALRQQIRQDTIKRHDDAAARAEQYRLDQIEREKQAAIERQEIRAQMQKRQEQMELARKQANEKQRQEADRRLKYYESLSPAEKKAYKAKQAAIQQQQNEMAARLFGAVLESALSPRVCERGSWLTGYTYYEC
jgi:colicin import membrane protein